MLNITYMVSLYSSVVHKKEGMHIVCCLIVYSMHCTVDQISGLISKMSFCDSQMNADTGSACMIELTYMSNVFSLDTN